MMGDVVRRSVHGALSAALLPRALSFHRSTRDTSTAQRRAFLRLQATWRGTAMARRHPELLHIDGVRALQSVAPLSTWNDMVDDANAAADGDAYARSASPIVRFERSGGSSGAQKLLPLTRAFLADVQRGLAPWLFDLYRRHAGLRSGSAYWSISPIGQKAAPTRGGYAVGADDDSSYLPAPMQRLMSQVLVASPALAAFPDIESCRYATLRLLLARDDLALVSVWSPTFLSLLLDTLAVHAEQLVDDVKRGTCRVPHAGNNVNAVAARMQLPSQPRRAAQLQRILAQHGRLVPTLAWPRLSMVSMWHDGESHRFVGDVASRLPGVALQPKGLLATEGIITVPITSAPAPVLCVESHVFEFVRDDGRVVLPHELAVGDVAEVVLSTSSGLLRYRLGDRVSVVGHHGDAPCLRFLGRAGNVSDLVGEKVSGEHVAAVFQNAQRATSTSPRFAMLVAMRKPPLRYCLYVEATPADAQAFGAAVEAGLCEGHPYRYARALGQLGCVEAVVVRNALRRYEEACIARGQRAGDIKSVALTQDDRFHDVFRDNTGVAA
jgi:GH3 auxin-responsive promoter